MDMTPFETAAMRAIAAREHRNALAERRAAREAHAAKLTPAPSRTTWRKDEPPAPRSRRATASAEAARAERIEANREAWATRHPEAAKAERKLRKERRQAQKRWRSAGAGTVETHEHAARLNQGALARLCRSGAIDADQLAAALEIQTVHERIGADVAIRTASLETRVDRRRWTGDDIFHENLARVRREAAYTAWRRALAAEGRAAPALAMIVGDGDGPIGFTIAARRYRMHHKKAKRLLIEALDLWWRMLGESRRAIDEASVAAAWAGLT